MPELTRRQMLSLTAMASTAPGFYRLSAETAGMAAASQENRPLPDWIRTNRTLIAEAYNPPFYPSLDYEPEKAVPIALNLNCNSMRFPSASYYAYFPTKSGYPLHPELKGDPMRRTFELLRKAGLKTIAYVPLNHPFMSIESKDPRYADWTRRYADGSPMITSHYGWGRFFEGCLNSQIHEIAMALTSEVLSHDVDVLYFDGPYEGMDHRTDFCYCRHCRAAFEKRFAAPIPDQHTCTLEERVRYVDWMRDEVVVKFFSDLRQMIRAQRDVPVLFNDTVLLAKQDWRSKIAIADGFMFEAAETPEEKLFNLELGKSTGKVIWTYLGHHTEYNREHMSDKSVRGWYSYPVEGQELLLDGAVATAAGVGCVYWGLQRFFYETELPDHFESGRIVRDIFNFQDEKHEVLRHLRLRPQAGILVSTQTINWYAGERFVLSAYGNYYRGAFNLLKSLSIEAEPFLDWQMTPKKLAGFELVFVANAACLSDAQCAMLREYVQAGGKLAATHLTSIADELGRIRKDFALADLFGVTAVDTAPFEYPDLYLKPAGGKLIPQDPQVMRIRATSGSVAATTWDRGNRRELGPAVVTHGYGKGECIYVASGLEAIYEETRMEPVRKYLGSLLLPHLESGRQYEMDFIPGVTPHLTVSEKHLVLYLLADIGDKTHLLKTRETFLPVEDVAVRLRIPGAIQSVRLMRAGTETGYKRDGEWIAVTVPRILIYEAIQVNLA